MRAARTAGLLLLLLWAVHAEEEYEIIEGDIMIPKSRKAHTLAMVGGYNLWALCDVPYKIVHDSYLTPENDHRIHEAIKMWTDRIPELNIRPATDSDTNYIQFVGRSTGGGRSPLGQVSNHRVEIGKNFCDAGCVAHEIGHSLGLAHEQSRNDRDDFVVLNDTNIAAPSEYSKMTNGHDLGPYDYNSLMHYTKSTFAVDSSRPTMITPHPIGQRSGPSQLDVEAIRFLYNDCKPVTGTPKCRASVKSNEDGTPLLIGHSRTFIVTFVGVAGKRMSVDYMSSEGGAALQSGLPAGATPQTTGITWTSGVTTFHNGGRIEFTPPSSSAGKTFRLAVKFTADSSATCEVEVKVAETNAVCFGIPSNNPAVCSGQGTCTGKYPFPCECHAGFGGVNCEAPVDCVHNVHGRFDETTDGWSTVDARVTKVTKIKGEGSLNVTNQAWHDFPGVVRPSRVTYWVKTPLRDQASTFAIRGPNGERCVSVPYCQESCQKQPGKGMFLFSAANKVHNVRFTDVTTAWHFVDIRFDWHNKVVSMDVDGSPEIKSVPFECSGVERLIFFANLGQVASEPSFLDDVRAYCHGHITLHRPSTVVLRDRIEKEGLYMHLELVSPTAAFVNTEEAKQNIIDAIAAAGDSTWTSAVRASLFPVNVFILEEDPRHLLVGPFAPMTGVNTQTVAVAFPASATTLGKEIPDDVFFNIVDECVGQPDGTKCNDGVAITTDKCMGGKCVGLATCERTCSSQKCDHWNVAGYSCARLESDFGCSCSLCDCSDPGWVPLKPCKPPTLPDGYNASLCSDAVPPGEGCPVVCPGGYDKGATVYFCMEDNTDPAGEVVGVLPSCTTQTVSGCSRLAPMGEGIDVSDCAAVHAGGSCTVRCATGFSGNAETFTCPDGNTDVLKQPQGTSPTCTRILPPASCAALALGTAFDTASCQSLAPGESCTVKCASGYIGGTASFSCPADNTDSSQQPTGSAPSCLPLVPCTSLSDAGTRFDVSPCKGPVPAGTTCQVNCATGYEGSPTIYACPSDNTDPTAQPSGGLPSCVPTSVACADLDLGDAFDVEECFGLAPGESCTVRCVGDHVGGERTFTCPGNNKDSQAPPLGIPPTCAKIVGCGALTGLGAAFDVSGCSAVAAGASCTVSCAAGFNGNTASYACSSENTDASRPPVGTPPTCVVVKCAALQLGDMYDVSQCASVAPGQTCTVTCATGMKDSQVFTCPPGAADLNVQPTGTLPSCAPVTCSVPSFGEGVDASDCLGKGPGATCTVRCAQGYLGGDASFTCPTAGGDITGTPPMCQKIVPCAALGAISASHDVSGCGAVTAGGSCVVRCAAGFSGNDAVYTCPAQNTDATQEPQGTSPSCVRPVVPCKALTGLDPKYSVDGCAQVAAGSTCTVGCAAGYVGSTTSFSCPDGNTDPNQLPAGTPPTCNQVVGCAPLSSMGGEYDVSGCAAVSAGGTCSVVCSSDKSVKATYLCPAANTNPSVQPEGTKPSCPIAKCEQTCYGYTCDQLYPGFTCSVLSQQYNCDCSGCQCLGEGCKPSCYGRTCDYWVASNSYSCSTLEKTYGCDCSGCACRLDSSSMVLAASLPGLPSSSGTPIAAILAVAGVVVVAVGAAAVYRRRRRAASSEPHDELDDSLPGAKVTMKLDKGDFVQMEEAHDHVNL